MNKKLIIIVAAAGLVSFSGTFVFAWLTKTSPQAQSLQVDQPTIAGQEAEPTLPQLEMPATGAFATVDRKMEKQLKDLVYEVREKTQEYDSKLKELKLYEQRLLDVQDTLKADIEELENLRIELASAVARLKSEQDKLLKSRVEIAKIEKNNLISIAATYDKMDAASAGKILTNISQVKGESTDDAVKILYYMSERSKAKVLAAIAETEPAISAYLCRRLKQITEKE
jgi:flagellar motility protein MotE (MotC chaperone)